MPSPSGPIGVILTDSCFAPPLPSTGEPLLMPRVCEESIGARQSGSMDGHGIPGACGNNGATPFACCKVIVSSMVSSNQRVADTAQTRTYVGHMPRPKQGTPELVRILK